jgi:GT2 family glycosyltransferase
VKQPRVSIIIPTYNHLEDCLKPCIESIIKYTDLTDKELIVVANGCKDGTVEYVLAVQAIHPTVKLINVPEAAGYTHATNLGISLSRGEKIVFLNNDTVLLPQPVDEWIKLLEIPFITSKNVGVTGPLKLSADGMDFEFIVFFVAMTSRKVLNEVGLLDESFSPGGCEDMDYALRAYEKDYRIALAGEGMRMQDTGKAFTGTFPIYHKAEGTFDYIPSYKQSFKDNILKLHKKFPQFVNSFYNDNR